MLDIFTGDAFTTVALTDAINKVPFVPGQASTIVPWAESGVTVPTIALEDRAGTLKIVNPSPRGGPGHTIDKQKRNMRVLGIPHYEVDDGVYADEVSGVRAFGSESTVETVQGRINERMAEIANQVLDPTIELQRLGALKGTILNGDGTTLYDLFTEFGESQPSAVDFVFSASPSTGAVRTQAATVKRNMAAALGGLTFSGIGALCSPTFFDTLIACKEIRETYLNQQQAQELRTGYAFGSFVFGDILWQEYRGATTTDDAGNSVTLGITADECIFFPLGVPGLYRTVYAPADYMETVNTVGLPRYAKQFPWDNDKGVRLEMQTNSLSFVTRPGVLIRGTNS